MHDIVKQGYQRVDDAHLAMTADGEMIYGEARRRAERTTRSDGEAAAMPRRLHRIRANGSWARRPHAGRAEGARASRGHADHAQLGETVGWSRATQAVGHAGHAPRAPAATPRARGPCRALRWPRLCTGAKQAGHGRTSSHRRAHRCSSAGRGSSTVTCEQELSRGGSVEALYAWAVVRGEERGRGRGSE
jgi:hypothetical protein